jgi:hypothetical protein
VNAVKRLLRSAGLRHLSRRLGTEGGWAKLLAALAGYGELRAYVESHRALWACARAQRVGLETALTQYLTAAPFAAALRRLQTIPGVEQRSLLRSRLSIPLTKLLPPSAGRRGPQRRAEGEGVPPPEVVEPFHGMR